MKERGKGIINYIILVLTVLAILLCIWNILREKQLKDMPIELSVIVRGQSSEGLDNVRRGIELAARDYNIDVTFITLSEENNVEEQKALIAREVELNAQAILLSAADSQLLCSAVAEAEVNCTPFVRQYDILNNKWGALLCRKEYQTNAIHQNSRSR